MGNSTYQQSEIVEHAVLSIDIQIETLQFLKASVQETSFKNAIQNILEMNGRLVVTGIGKSAIIAQKMVATFNSTGTPSLFMHAADAVHGDLGMVQQGDLVICISKSGNSPEIKALIPLIKSRGIKVFGMTANKESFLALNADEILHTPVEKEACPNNLAPTSSTTSQLVLGDALAVTLINLRKFGKSDFAQHHPGGALGKKLYLTLQDLIKAEAPAVNPNTEMKEVILEISKNRQGAVAVLENQKVVGIVTDGDIRRMLESETNWMELKAKDIMGTQPKEMPSDALAFDAFQIMEQHSITQILVVDNSSYKGMVHLHDILKEGIF